MEDGAGQVRQVYPDDTEVWLRPLIRNLINPLLLGKEY